MSGPAYPLTHPQQRIWWVEHIWPGTGMHNLGGTVRVGGAVDFARLGQAIHLFVQKHPLLRTQVFVQGEDMWQQVVEWQPPQLVVHDFRKEPDPQAAFEAWAQHAFATPFALTGTFLHEFHLFCVSDELTGYLCKFHHLICDGWSINLMTAQIGELYEALGRSEAVEVAPAPEYREFYEREQRYIASKRFVDDRAFWLDSFADLDRFAALLQTSPSTAGHRLTMALDPVRSQQVHALCMGQNISLNTLYVLLMLVRLSRLTREQDLIVGIPVLNRSGPKEKNTFGMFTSSMPFRATIAGEESAGACLRRLQKELMSCYFHQKYPYDRLVQDLELKKRGLDSLYQVCVNTYNTKMACTIDGMPVENVEYYNGHQPYSLQVVVKEWDEQVTLQYDYKTDDYTAEQVAALHAELNVLLDQLLVSVDRPLGKLRLLDEWQAHHQLRELNRTEAPYPRGATVQELFERQVDRAPERVALVDGERRLTYRELEERSNQVAHVLRRRGIGRDSFVGLRARHSLELVIGVLGVLKAGGAYVPIDPDYPAARATYMLEDAGIALLLTAGDSLPELPFAGERLALDDQEILLADTSRPQAVSGSQDLAYMIYTSGSTGLPKGVMIEQRGLVNYVWWAKDAYFSSPEEAIALYSSLSFDLTVTSLFPPLLNGNAIYTYDAQAVDEFVLHRILREDRVHVLKLTPAHLALLTDGDYANSQVRRLIVGGEDLKANLARSVQAAFGGVEIWNEYGPTEAVVGCVVHRFDPSRELAGSVPIGRPIANQTLYLLDQHLQPVPKCFAGEICLSGDGIARGYHNRPRLTAERFVDHLYEPGRKLYRTGDLARRRADGVVEYLGRMDDQVKINGYRIELREIENQLLALPQIREATVIEHESDNARKSLVAFVVSDGTRSASACRQALADTLPPYMIPTRIVFLHVLPMTPNGKIDRNALLAQVEQEGESQRDDEMPLTPLEADLAAVYQDVLGVQSIARYDDYYQLGGDSIKAIQISARLQAIGHPVRATDILTHQTVQELAERLHGRKSAAPVDQTPREGQVLPTPITAWFFAQQLAVPYHWNQTVRLTLTRRVEPRVWRQAVAALFAHHDSLRLQVEGTSLFYQPLSNRLMEGVATVIDLAHCAPEEQERQMQAESEALQSRFSFGNGLLFKACLFELGADRPQRALLIAHHLIIDGVSWRLLLDDLMNACQAVRVGKECSLPPKTHALQEWAEALHEYGRTDAWAELDYWNSQSAAPLFSEGNEPDDRSAVVTVETVLDEQATRRWLFDAHDSYRTRPHELLTAALALAVGEVGQREEVVIELEGHGRETLPGLQRDVSRTVGWFTSLYPLRLPSLPHDPDRQLKRVKQAMRTVPNGGLGYGVLRWLTHELTDAPLGVPASEVRFNYLGDLDSVQAADGFTLEHTRTAVDSAPENRPTCGLDAVAAVQHGRLHLSLTCRERPFVQMTADELLKRWAAHLAELVEHCLQHDDVEFTPSDFPTARLTQELLDGLFQ